MARQYFVRSTVAVLAVGLGFGCLASRAEHARAQSLQRLTVEAFDLSADTAHPRLGATFHLVVRLHVREKVAAIENLELPILAQLELLGDERSIATNAAGTEYTETITVAAHNTGTITVAPATLQAIDARDRQPKEYATNALTLEVAAESSTPLQQGGDAAVQALALTARVALWIGGVACVAAVLALVFLRRPLSVGAPAQSAPAQPAPAPVLPAPSSPHERLRDALTVLRAERSRAAAVVVRTAVWEMAGAGPGETLEDVLLRPAASNPAMADLLRCLERAAFTYDGDLDAAIADACAALERLA